MHVQGSDAADLAPGEGAQANAPALVPTQGLRAQVVHAQGKRSEEHQSQGQPSAGGAAEMDRFVIHGVYEYNQHVLQIQTLGEALS
jgi:hypothetical protein